MSTTTTVTGTWHYYDPDDDYSHVGSEPEIVTVTNTPEALAEDLRSWLGGMDPGVELTHQWDTTFLVSGTIEGEPHEFLARFERNVTTPLGGWLRSVT